MIDIISLIIACNYIRNKVRTKGYDPRPYVWRLVGLWILFEVSGAALSLTLNGNIFIAVGFGLFCGFGGFLIVKHKVDKLPSKGNWMDTIGKENNQLPPQ